MLANEGREHEVFTPGLWDTGPHEDLIESLHLAIMSAVETLSAWPSIRQVVKRLLSAWSSMRQIVKRLK